VNGGATAVNGWTSRTWRTWGKSLRDVENVEDVGQELEGRGDVEDVGQELEGRGERGGGGARA
jgi:hypothetical protein